MNLRGGCRKARSWVLGTGAVRMLGCGLVGWALCEGGEVPKGRFLGAEEMPVDTR